MITGNVFVKLPHPWHDLILMLHVEQLSNKLPPICHEKLLKKVPPYFMGDIMPLLHWKIMWGICFLSICKEVQTKTC